MLRLLDTQIFTAFDFVKNCVFPFSLSAAERLDFCVTAYAGTPLILSKEAPKGGAVFKK